MNPHQDIVYGDTSGQKLYCACPEGRPSGTPTVQVFAWDQGDDETALSATTGSASVGSFTTTVDQTSGATAADPHLLYVTSTTNAEVGRSYLITGTLGQKEWIDVVEIDAGATLRSRFALHQDFAISSDVEDTRIEIAVDSTWVAAEVNISDRRDPNPGYRARWVYVVGGITYVRNTYFDLVRVAGFIRHDVRAADIDARIPGWIRSLPRDHGPDGGQRLIDSAAESVMLDLMQNDIPDQQLRNNDVVRELIIWRAAHLRQLGRQIHDGTDVDATEMLKTEYQSRLEQLIRITNRTAIAVDSSGAGALPTRKLFVK